LLSRRTGVDLVVVEDAVRRARQRVAVRSRSSADNEPSRRLTGGEKAEHEVLRALLANVSGWRAVGIDRSLFTMKSTRAAFDILWPVLEITAEGVDLDLGALIGDDDTVTGRLLRRLAFAERPLPELTDVVNSLKVGELQRRIDSLRRDIEQIDPSVDADAYSARFAELIALERRRREMRSED